MAIFKEVENWDGTSYNPEADRDDSNHESDLPLSEVTRLVAGSAALFPLGGVPGEGGTLFAAFRDALQSATAEILVVKGIHQRDLDPHIRVSLPVDGAVHQFHVNVATSQRITTDLDGRKVAGKNQHFVWKPVRVSVAIGKGLERKVYGYPMAAPARDLGGRRRGLSFTQGQLQDHIEAAQAAAAERDRVAKEKAAAAALERDRVAKIEAAAANARISKNLAALGDRARAGGNPWGAK